MLKQKKKLLSKAINMKAIYRVTKKNIINCIMIIMKVIIQLHSIKTINNNSMESKKIDKNLLT
jgi:hypothetical protein